MLDQQLLHSCIDNLPHGIIILHRDSLIYVNRRMTELLGYDQNELLKYTTGKLLSNILSHNQNDSADMTDQIFLVSSQGIKIPCSITRNFFQSEPVIILIEKTLPSSADKQLAYMLSIIQDSAQCIIGTDLEGTIVTWNQAAGDVYGYTAEDVIGRNISIIMPPDIRFSTLNRIINGEYLQKQRTYAWTKQGILVNVELSISPIKDDRGEIRGISFFSRDITLEIMAEKKISYQARLLEAVNDSILGADFDGNITYWNKGSECLFGWKAEEVIGKSYSMLFVDEDFNELFNSMEEITPGQWEGVKRVCTSKDGKKYVRVSINTIYDEMEQPDFLVIVFTDISEIIEARLKAEEAVRFKSEFMANISHEIRTPLSSVIGYAELLDENNFDQYEKKYLQGIKQNSSQLLDLINDFLDLSKIEANSMLLDEVSFDIKDLIHSSLKVFEPDIKNKNLKVHINIDENVPDKVRGDRIRIRQVYNNLLSNAVKFTKKGEISILVNIFNRGEKQNELPLSITVIDTGIGIPVDKTSDIFTPYTQVDSTTNTKYGGTGLGLAISKRLVELMKGSINVESVPGKGSKFQVILPLKYADNLPDWHETGDKSIADKNKIILISDNKVLISKLYDGFGGSNYLPVSISFNKDIEKTLNFYQPSAVIAAIDEVSNDRHNCILSIKKLLEADNIPLILYSDKIGEGEVCMYTGTHLINDLIDTEQIIQLLYNADKTEIADACSDHNNVLICDDNYINLKLMSNILENADYNIYNTSNITAALELLGSYDIDVMLVDMEFVDSNRGLIETLLELRPRLEIIGLKKSEFQYHDKIKFYIDRPYTNHSLLAAINNCIILNNIGRGNDNA